MRSNHRGLGVSIGLFVILFAVAACQTPAVNEPTPSALPSAEATESAEPTAEPSETSGATACIDQETEDAIRSFATNDPDTAAIPHVIDTLEGLALEGEDAARRTELIASLQTNPLDTDRLFFAVNRWRAEVVIEPC